MIHVPFGRLGTTTRSSRFGRSATGAPPLGVLILLFAFLVPTFGQVTAPKADDTPGLLLNNSAYISPRDLPSRMAISHEQTGKRMSSADKAQVAITGTITDAKGSRQAQVTIAAPGYMSYREDKGKSLVYDGAGLKGSAGPLVTEEDGLVESLLAHFPDSIYLQFATGGSSRRIGSHFRADGGKAAGYTGPYYTVISFSPAKRTGLEPGKALQQEIFVLIDEKTDLIAEVRTVVNASRGAATVNQTQFGNWRKQDDQWFPNTITRMENGKQIFSFQVLQAVAGPADAAEKFKP